MGAAESRQLSSEAPTSGYHVVRVAANSPAHLAGIEPFFDFCVGLDGQALSLSNFGEAGAEDDDAMGVWKQLEEKEGTQVTLNVWSSKRQELRGTCHRHWSQRCSALIPNSRPDTHLYTSLAHRDRCHAGPLSLLVEVCFCSSRPKFSALSLGPNTATMCSAPRS